MTNHAQSTEELESHLREHLQFLKSSADAYDGGFEGEAKRIAVSIRVLVHDTGRSRSLLGQLSRKEHDFVDSAFPLVPHNKSTHSGLVVTSMVPGIGAKYVAFLDKPPHGQVRSVNFDSWWSAPVFIDSSGRTMNRKDLILTVANQDGGAHVDSALDATYADLSRNNSLGWVYSDSNKSAPEPLSGPERAALRQICHEILKTLVPGYAKDPVYPAEGVVFGGMVLLQEGPIHPKPQKQSRGTKVGRNERCPCGSGLKYKRCCGAVA
jgi:hypothetical protein